MKKTVLSLSIKTLKMSIAALPVLFIIATFQGCSSNTNESTDANSGGGNMMKDAEEMKDDGK